MLLSVPMNRMRLVQDMLLEHLHSLLSGGLGSSKVKPSFCCSVQSRVCRFPYVSSIQRCCHHRVSNKNPRSLARIILWISWLNEQLYLIAVWRQTGAQSGTEAQIFRGTDHKAVLSLLSPSSLFAFPTCALLQMSVQLLLLTHLFLSPSY